LVELLIKHGEDAKKKKKKKKKRRKKKKKKKKKKDIVKCLINNETNPFLIYKLYKSA